MTMNLFMLFAIPIFTFAILIEYYFTKKNTTQSYPLKDAATSISMGIGSVILGYFFHPALDKIFIFLSQYSIFSLPHIWKNLITGSELNIWLFLLLLVVDDFTYYWFHRISHECRLFWCFHETHHSSESYNFSTALRQTWTGVFFGFVFWIPMVLVGFRIEDIFIQINFNLFYQFWIHTRYTKSIKYFDFIFNTPSHHRVHHAKNIEYLDKNFAGIFIIWDRIFGTFQKEKCEPRYGVLSPPNSFNPFYIGLHMCAKLMHDVFYEKNLLCKLKYLFYRPGWTADGSGKTTKDLQSSQS